MPRVGEENRIFLQQLLFVFGLKYNDVLQPNTSAGKPKLVQAYDDIDDHLKASEYNWKLIQFYHFPKEAPHRIQTVLKDEQNTLLASNNELEERWLLFEEVNNHISMFQINNTGGIFWLNGNGKLMVTKRSALGLCNDYVVTNKFYDPLWMHQYKMVSTQ